MSTSQQKTFSLRNLDEQDVSWIIEASNDVAIQQMTSHGGAQTQEAALSVINCSNGDFKSWAILGDNEPLGVISIHSVDGLSATADVGYWVAPWARRQGAAAAALRLLEKELSSSPEIACIQLKIMYANEPSLALARSLGFEEVSSGSCSCGTQGEVSARVFEKRI
ncbi:MAG: hypothetical protein RLY59_509 [Actinomycetota bacterium]